MESGKEKVLSDLQRLQSQCISLDDNELFKVTSHTQCIDAVSKRKQGSVDVCPFYHSLSTILEHRKRQKTDISTVHML